MSLDRPTIFISINHKKPLKSLLRARSILWLTQNGLEPFSTRILPKGLGQLFSEHKPLLLALVLGIFSFLTKNLCPKAPLCLKGLRVGWNATWQKFRLKMVPSGIFSSPELGFVMKNYLWGTLIVVSVSPFVFLWVLARLKDSKIGMVA